MADLTGSLTSSAKTLSSGSRYLTLEFNQSRKIADNESKIMWTLKGAGTYTGYVMSGPFEVKIDNKVVYSNSNRIRLYKGTLVGSGELTVKHNNDGSRQLPISISAAIYDMSTNVSGSQTFTLMPNPRESKVSASDTEIGKVCNIVISKGVDSYTSSISYKLYKDNSRSSVLASGQIDEPKTPKTTIQWEVPTSFYELLWNTPTGYCEIFCTTYNGNNVVGNTTSTAIWITMDESASPQISEYTAVNVDPATVGITGANGYIVGTGLITVKCSALANKSATISGITVINGTNTYNLTDREEFQIANPTDSNFVFRATDSRGKTVERSIELVAYDYTTLSISITQLRMEIDPNDRTKGLITLSVDGTGYNGTIGSTTNAVTVAFTLTDTTNEDGKTITVENTAELNWSSELDGAYHFYEVKDVVIPVDDSDATYKVVATVKDLINTEGINSAELSVNRVPVYDYGKNDFNFNVPIYYKNKPYIDIKKTTLETNYDYDKEIPGQVDWIYKTTEDTYVELWGKHTIHSVLFYNQVGNMWAPAKLKEGVDPTKIDFSNLDEYLDPYPTIILPLPEDVILELGNMECPLTITASVVALDEYGTPDTEAILMAASPYVTYDYSGLVAGLNCVGAEFYACHSIEISIHISGTKPTEWLGDDWDDEDWNEDDWGDEYVE